MNTSGSYAFVSLNGLPAVYPSLVTAQNLETSAQRDAVQAAASASLGILLITLLACVLSAIYFARLLESVARSRINLFMVRWCRPFASPILARRRTPAFSAAHAVCLLGPGILCGAPYKPFGARAAAKDLLGQPTKAGLAPCERLLWRCFSGVSGHPAADAASAGHQEHSPGSRQRRERR